MRTTGMCALLVCLFTVLPGQSTSTRQREDTERFTEKHEHGAAAVLPEGTTGANVRADSGPSPSLGKISFLSLFYLCFVLGFFCF